MTKEQEAIESLEQLINIRKNKAGQIKYDNCICSTTAIETILNMLKEKDAEIHQKNTELAEKKDKMIDLLIDYIDTLSEYYTRAEGKNNEFCDEKCIDKNIDCYDCIKQYFERKAEQKGE
jgi:hypothetical protein|nr:MAG TPA: hypothetical protein [Caudoviricetes sp.]